MRDLLFTFFVYILGEAEKLDHYLVYSLLEVTDYLLFFVLRRKRIFRDGVLIAFWLLRFLIFGLLLFVIV